MRVTLWGTRGSLAAAGPETVRYGGNTSCAEVRAGDGSLVVLDAGTGIRRLGAALAGGTRRIDLLLTHLHMDHIQGLGFFAPFFEADREIHVWGPPSTTLDLRARLTRYLSPPLFPVRLRDLPCRLALHEVPQDGFEAGAFRVSAALVVAFSCAAAHLVAKFMTRKARGELSAVSVWFATFRADRPAGTSVWLHAALVDGTGLARRPVAATSRTVARIGPGSVPNGKRARR